VKIAFFSDSFRDNTGGLTKAVTGLHDVLISQGHQVTVFTLPQKSKPLHRGNVIFVPALPLPALAGIPPDSYFSYGYGEALRTLQNIKPDIVHVHTMYSVSWIGLLAAAKLKIPAIATYHANVKIALSLLTQKLPGPPAGATSSNLTERAISVLARSFYNRFAAVIAPSEFAAGSLRSFGVVTPIHVIPSGIDARLFSPDPVAACPGRHTSLSVNPCVPGSLAGDPAESGELGSVCNVLYAGRLSAEKGVETLVRVIKTLEEERGASTRLGFTATPARLGATLRFTIAGDGPLMRRVENDLRHLVERGKVEFRGFVPWDLMPGEYRRAQIFFLPSAAETQGLAALEAMACRLPVVAVKGGAVPEFVEDGNSGFLFDPGNIEGMCGAIRNLEARPQMRRVIGERARRAALKFDWGQLVGKFTGLYAQYLR